MAQIVQDLRYAARTFRKSPMFVAVAIGSLALGIGANTAIFSLVDQVLLRLLPVKNPQQLVLLWGRGEHYGSNDGRHRLSYPMYADFRDHNDVFSGMFCQSELNMSVGFEGRTERVQGQLVSGTYFPVLGVGAALGRVFTPDDDRTPGGHPVAVISYRYWVSRFAANPDVIGKKLILNGYPFTIIGVSQAGFDGTDPAVSPQVRVPVTMKAQVDPTSSFAGSESLTNRRSRWVTVFGRLKPGVSIERARTGLQPFFHQMLQEEVQEAAFAHASPLTKQNFLKMWIDVLPASNGDSYTRDRYSNPLLVLTAIVALLLLIACANVANLLIARAAARQKEIAIRLAMGANRWRIVSQMLIESLMLAIAGGAAGLALAVWMDRALVDFLPVSATPITMSATPDWRILAFTLGVSLLTGVLFGLIPALQSTRPNVAATLKDQVGSIAGGTAVGLRKSLVTAQIALSLLLLVGAGLFVRSLRNLKDLDPGFNTANLITFAVNPTLNGYKPERSLQFYRQLQEDLDAIPGVEASSLAVVAILRNNEWDSSMSVESYTAKPGEGIQPYMNYISPGYFKTMDIAVMQGRDFRVTDSKGAAKVAIVNEKFAKRYFKDGKALGHRIGMGGDPGTKLDIEIVGIVRDIKYENLRDEMPIEVYLPYVQHEVVLGMQAYVRTARDPDRSFAAVRKVVDGLDPNVPVFEMKTLEQQTDESLIAERAVATLSTAFGFLAALLAAIGLYGVMAYSVARRTREIGVRMALGAESGDVIWLVLKEVVMLASIGIAAGLLAAWGLTKLVKSQLYGIAPNDVMTLVLATVGIACVALLAGYIPARRATRIDPMNALRFE